MIVRILLGIGKVPLRKRLLASLKGPDLVIELLSGRDRLWEQIAKLDGDVILISKEWLPEPIAESVTMIRNLPDAPWVVAVTTDENSADRARLLAAGCEAVLNENLPTSQFNDVLGALCAKRAAASQQSMSGFPEHTRASLNDFVSNSTVMRTFMETVRRVTASDASLLILGETGVGKERLARAIHAESKRSGGPFVAVNCGGLPESLLESELYGHEEGAFTGASRSRRGAFEMAHRGTIFLDEIGDLAHHLQVKLLRVLQEKEVQRIGSEKTFSVDVRVIAATNRNLEEEVAAKRFRQDLFYRLGVVALTIPPLRQRREDIPALVESYIQYFHARIGRSVDKIEPAALTALQNYQWPGNVRELINVLERAMLLTTSTTIRLEDLPAAISHTLPPPVGMPPAAQGQPNLNVPEEWLHKPLKAVRRTMVDYVERAYLAGLLRETQGRIGETARRAGIEPRSLFEKMRRLNLHKEDFKKKKTKS
ncbi:MAG: sigma-54 dependent transcriptional regulator [Planctomycetes bacterium]|nr:sigma-54 dependent transcriptional regulator [Planctomycetota bacterium]